MIGPATNDIPGFVGPVMIHMPLSSNRTAKRDIFVASIEIPANPPNVRAVMNNWDWFESMLVLKVLLNLPTHLGITDCIDVGIVVDDVRMLLDEFGIRIYVLPKLFGLVLRIVHFPAPMLEHLI